MFKSSRWRSEKNKIKAVFKLQFHATQVLQLNADSLILSVVPADAGKPTGRLEKGIVQEGSCRWENPVYETVKFTQDARTGKINERKYQFIVSSGSSKHNLVGEVCFDFAVYAEATKASTVSLPLKNSKSNGVLHVSIQRLQANVDQRDVDGAEDTNLKSQNRTLDTLLSNVDVEEGTKGHSTEDRPLNNGTQSAELNGNHSVYGGSDITMSSSESSSGLTTPRELGVRNNILQEPTSFLSSQRQSSLPLKQTANASATIYEEHPHSQWEWSGDADNGMSIDDLTNSTLATEMSEQATVIEIEKLKAELIALARQADMSELELQTLRKQIVKESRKGQDLSREVMSLKEERDALKAECEKLKALQKHIEDARSKTKLQFEGGDPWVLLEEIRQELTYEKDLNSNLRLQLQKTQESNAELILAVKDLDEMLEQKNREISNHFNNSRSCENVVSRSKTDDDEEQKALEELVKEHTDAKETYLLEQKIMDLCSEIEIYRRDKDEIEMQMEQLALDYEILKQENHDISYKLEQSQLQEQLKMQYECSSFANLNELEAQIENLENVLKKQSKDYSDSLVTINELEAHIKSLEEELEKRALGFEADLEAITQAKVQQEQRAIRAEEALRNTRWKNANTAEKLQEEFRRLSMQMASTFNANEKVAMKALAEAGQLRMQKSQLEGMLHKADEQLQSIRDDYEAKLRELCLELDSKMDQIEQLLAEIDDKSKQLEYQKKHEEELREDFRQEVLNLKAELDRLVVDNNILSEQVEHKENMRLELEQMKTSIKQTEALVQRGNIERNELVNMIALVKKEAEKSMEEFNRMRCLKDENEIAMSHLQSEVETLKTQCNDLKHSLIEDEMEKEKLRKQAFQLKSELKKKEDAIANIEKKLKESNKRTTISDGTKTIVRNNKISPINHGSKEFVNLKEKINLLEGQIKLKETALETSTNSFLEKERDLLNKIEELESRMEELNQKIASCCNNSCKELAEDGIGITSSGGMAKENGNSIPVVNSNHAFASEKEPNISTIETRGQGADDLISELITLKERNKLMETELKEMQERYSEISLKFAEVEGERQQLVMKVRNLKNSRKS